MREPKERRRSRNSESLDGSNFPVSSDDIDFDTLLVEDSSDSVSELDNIFKRKTSNPFSSNLFSKAMEESDLEERARTDTNVVYSTGYSIHVLTPYILTVLLIAVIFIGIDKYVFNIMKFLSQDIRYKIPAYGIMFLVFVIIMYMFIKKSFDYINFQMYMTKYKVVYGWKFLKKKNEITLFSIQESLNKNGLLGLIFNYGSLKFFTTTRRKYSFDKIHGAQYIYKIIKELQYGDSKGSINQNAIINNILSGGKEVKGQTEETSVDADTVDFSDLSSLGFSEEEIKSFNLSPKTRAKRGDNSNTEADTLNVQESMEANESNMQPNNNTRVSRRNRSSSSSYDRRQEGSQGRSRRERGRDSRRRA